MNASQRKAMFARMHYPTMNQADKVGIYPVIVRTKYGFMVLSSSHAESDHFKKLKDAKAHYKDSKQVQAKWKRIRDSI